MADHPRFADHEGIAFATEDDSNQHVVVDPDVFEQFINAGKGTGEETDAWCQYKKRLDGESNCEEDVEQVSQHQLPEDHYDMSPVWNEDRKSPNGESNCEEDVEQVSQHQLPDDHDGMFSHGEHGSEDNESFLDAFLRGGSSSAPESTPTGTGASGPFAYAEQQNRGYNMKWVHSFTRQELRSMRRHGLTGGYGIDNQQVVNFKAWQQALRKDPKAKKKDFWFIVDVGNVDREGRVKKERDRQLLRIGLELVPDDQTKGKFMLVEVPPSDPAQCDDPQ